MKNYYAENYNRSVDQIYIRSGKIKTVWDKINFNAPLNTIIYAFDHTDIQETEDNLQRAVFRLIQNITI